MRAARRLACVTADQAWKLFGSPWLDDGRCRMHFEVRAGGRPGVLETPRLDTVVDGGVQAGSDATKRFSPVVVGAAETLLASGRSPVRTRSSGRPLLLIRTVPRSLWGQRPRPHRLESWKRYLGYPVVADAHPRPSPTTGPPCLWVQPPDQQLPNIATTASERDAGRAYFCPQLPA